MQRIASPEIPGYALTHRIGEGGAGIVWEATRLRDGDRVALKILRSAFLRDPATVRRFEREARLLSRLRHPGIVPVSDSGHHGGRYYLVMPLVLDPTLATLLGAGERVSRPDAPHFGAVVSVLTALEAIHQQGVIHRDLTPGNVFVRADGSGLLADFGIVKILGSESELTRSGALVGTLPYMSPEQLAGDPVSPASDVYQAGLLLYHIVSGGLPFEFSLAAIVAAKCVADALPDPRDHGAIMTDGMARLIARATARKASDRFPSAIALATALERELSRWLRACAPAPVNPRHPS